MATATWPTKPTSLPTRNGTAGPVPASQDAPSATLVTISPSMAAAWLADAHANRPISKARVRMITRAIVSGKWQVNGQPIIVCDQNRVLDGRHRLSAVVEANMSIETMVVVGVDPASFLTMDAGKRRNGGDVLGIAGHKQSQLLASALRWLWRYEHAEMLRASIPIADYELVASLDQHQTIITSLSWGCMLKAMIPAGAAAMLHFCMSGKDPGLAKRFFTSLAQGIALSGDDPEYKVRERLLHAKRETHHTAIVERCALIIRAWNARRATGRMPAGVWQGTSSTFPQVE